MSTLQMLVPRTVKAAPEPLGWYVRPSYIDHRAIADAVAGGSVGLHGVVLDPSHEDRHSELRDLVVERNGDAVLDPRTQELGSIGGFNARLAALPWALERPHRPDDFSEEGARGVVDSIARRVVEKGCTAVLARTHYIESANSPWLEVDVRSTRQLRRCLDSANFLLAGGFVRSVPDRRGAPRHPRSAERCAHRLPVDQGFAKRRVDACRSKASGERGCRLALARRASRRRHDGRAARDRRTGIRSVGGICQGVTQKERFNARSWTRTENSGNPGFTWAPRIYVALLDMHLKRNEAEAFFEARGSKSRFGCRQRNCCPKGVKDMLDNPVRHSLVQRWGEIRRLSDVPEHLRAQRFLEETLRPATDAAVFSESLLFAGEDHLARRMSQNRKVVERLRVGLGSFVQESPVVSFSKIPLRRALRG